MKKINILNLTDIHLGHNRNRTYNIINNLIHFFKVNLNKIKKVDMIVITGDVFHRLLNTYSEDYLMSIKWLTELIRFCSDNKIKLRILEGTPSHDWKQCSILNDIVQNLKEDVDFKYIDTLYVEKINDLNLSICYLPDEYRHDAKDTYTEVLNILKENHLLKVDIMFGHGAFKYQMPDENISYHDETSYINIVKYLISFGHIHTPSSFGIIKAPGSFDRTAHGEEHDKGAMLYTIEKGECSFEFLVNKLALKFITFNYTKEDNIENIVNDVEKRIYKIEEGSFVRLLVNNNVFLSKSIKSLKNKYPNYTVEITKESEKKEQLSTRKVLDVILEDSTFSITKDNIEVLLFKELGNLTKTPIDLKIAKEEFDRIFNNI